MKFQCLDVARYILAINNVKPLNKLSDSEQLNGSVPNPRLYKGKRLARNKQEIDLQCSWLILKELEDS